FARFDGQAEIVDGPYGAKALCDIADLEQRQSQSPPYVAAWRRVPASARDFRRAAQKNGFMRSDRRSGSCPAPAEARTIIPSVREHRPPCNEKVSRKWRSANSSSQLAALSSPTVPRSPVANSARAMAGKGVPPVAGSQREKSTSGISPFRSPSRG